MKKNNLKQMVETILKDYPKTRDDDITLTQAIWWKYFKDLLIEKTNEINNKKEFWINISNIRELPREDHIKRYRAQIQNDDRRFLPTNLEIAKKRRWSEMQWRLSIRDEKLIN